MSIFIETIRSVELILFEEVPIFVILSFISLKLKYVANTHWQHVNEFKTIKCYNQIELLLF